jgi:hypothetical protein
MTKTLEQRLRDAKDELNKATVAVGRNVGRVSAEVDAEFRVMLETGDELHHWLGLLEARAAAREMLAGLEARADADGRVALGATRIMYAPARLIGMQAYLTNSWALADRLSGMVSRVLCIQDAWNDPKKPPQLVSFVSKGQTKSVAAMLCRSMRQTFGWPIGVSYALRNHFVHAGGQQSGIELFAGPTPQSSFALTVEGWNHVMERATSYGVDPGRVRAASLWPADPRADLRMVLDVCEREMDDALGILVGSACRSLVAHVACVLGED